MHPHIRLLLLTVVAVAGLTGTQVNPVICASSMPSCAQMVRIPFVENAGQWSQDAAFYAPTFGGGFFVTASGQLVYVLGGDWPEGETNPVVVREVLVGGASANVEGMGRETVRVSYFVGKEANRWAKGLASYGRVGLGEVYERIEVDLCAHSRSIEKRFVIGPGGEPSDIRVRVSVDGRRAGGSGGLLSLSSGGELVVAVGPGDVTFTRPIAYQETGHGREYVDVAYRFAGDEYGFSVGSYDRSRALVIDPLLASTFFGGSDGDGLYEIPSARDSQGNIYIGDRTKSWDLPTTPAGYDTSLSGASDIFIAKFDGDLTTLLAATFLGGSGREGGWPGANLILDDAGTVWVTAVVHSPDFPWTPGAYDSTYNGYGDFFIARLSGDLEQLLAATYIGGSWTEERPHLAVDGAGHVFLVGNTASADYPAIYGCMDTTYAGGSADVVVSKLDTALTTLHASTYIGGPGFDAPEEIVVDGYGYPYITGWTMSPVWPVTEDAYCDSFVGGSYDAFITRLEPDLSDVSASTFLGGARWDFGFDIILEGDYAVYVTGHTASIGTFPTTPGAYDRTYGGWGAEGVDDDSYVSKLSADLTTLIASSYLGGSGWENGVALALDGEGHIYIGGNTCSENYRTSPTAYDTTYGGSTNLTAGDIFVTCLDTSLTTMSASTYFGGDDVDNLGSFIWGGDGLYLAGGSNSSDFPTTPGSYDESFNGGESLGADRNWGGDVFISKLDPLLSNGSASVKDRSDWARDILFSASPNPFTGVATITFGLAGETSVRLAVYDVTGELIRTLVDARLAAGEHNAVWDGKDEMGMRVAPGVYFSALEGDDAVVHRKIVFVR
jgi:hypothetical protein